jgi:hypothetical protein
MYINYLMNDEVDGVIPTPITRRRTTFQGTSVCMNPNIGVEYPDGSAKFKLERGSDVDDCKVFDTKFV